MFEAFLLCLFTPMGLMGAANALEGPDRVVLEDGEVLEGRVLFEDELAVILRMGKELVELERSSVGELHTLERSLEELFDRYDQLAPLEASSLVDLARFAQSRGLGGEAHVLMWMALLREPQNKHAHAALGARATPEGCELELDGRWLPLEDYRRAHETWKHAWRLDTTHFRLRTDMPLADALLLALDLERFYRTLRAFLQELDRTHTVETGLVAHLYANEADYPPGPLDRDAWFDPVANRLNVDVSAGFGRSVVIHEATHLMLANLLRSGSGSTGRSAVGARRGSRIQLPPWLDEGLAEDFATSVSGPDGALTLRPRVRSDYHLRHGTEAEPIDLDRLLSLGGGAFWSGERVELRYAQSYTLVQFLLVEEANLYRDGFFEYWRKALAGKSAATHFRRTIAGSGEAADRFERAWHEYAQRVASGR